MGRPRRPDGLRRLTLVHGLSAAADATFAVSLADSLFFNVSVDAARPRIFVYLAVTMAPFAVLAPLIGPYIDRVRGGQRTVLVATSLGRAALAVALTQDLRTLLLFPEAFGVLVLAKAYSVARTAVVPRLVDDPASLTAANARLARVSLIGGAVGGALGVGVLALSSASGVLVLAAALFVAAAGFSATVAAGAAPRRPSRIEYQELHAVRLARSQTAMGLLRASVGLIAFLVAFELKRAGAPVWAFGLPVAAGWAGAMSASLVSGRLRARFSEERILVGAVALPAVAATVGALWFGTLASIYVTAVIGFAAAGGKHSFDAIVQRNAPDVDLGRALAGFEARFQLYWIGGAALAVISPLDARLLLLLVGLTMAGATVALHVALHASDRFEAAPSLVAAITGLVLDDAREHPTPLAVVDAADSLVRAGSPRAAVVVAASAIAVVDERGGAVDDDVRRLVDSTRRAVVDGHGVDEPGARAVVDAARRVVQAHLGPAADDRSETTDGLDDPSGTVTPRGPS